MLRKLCLRPRLLTAFFVVSLFTLSVGTLGYTSLWNIGDSTVKSVNLVSILNNMYDYNVDADNSVSYMLRFEEPIIKDYLRQVLLERTTKLQGFMDDYVRIQSKFGHIFMPGEMQDMTNIQLIYNESYIPILKEIMELHQSGETDKAISIYEKRLDPIYTHIFYNVGIAFDRVFREVENTVDNNFKYAQASAFNMLWIVAASLIVSIVLTLVVTRSISVPLAAVKNTAEKMAEGNLDIHFEERGCKDEVAYLAMSLNKTVQQLQQVEKLRTESMEMRISKEKAEAVSRSKMQFLAKMSHEIRTPMNAVIGMAELALREGIPGVAYGHVTAIKQAGASLLSIVNDILDISKVESGKLEIISANYEFASVISDVVSIINMKVMDTNLEFTVDIDSNVRNELYGDEIRMRQILLNLLSNAVKYTESGNIILKVRNEEVDVKDVVVFVIEITDTGKGIKQEDLDNVFCEFVQLDLEKNKGIEGTGLGLSITKSLVKAMAGDIAVKSEYGAGSTFTVTLPQKVCGPQRFGDCPTNDYAPKKDCVIKFIAPDARVLVVDDVGTNLTVAQGLLVPYKVQTDLCKSGGEAIEAVKVCCYDLVLMDQMMPGMDGIEATAHIRKIEGDYYANLPIIALTANVVFGAKDMFLQNGFNDFLAKPVELAKLNRILEKWIPTSKQIPAERSVNCQLSNIDTNIVIDGIDVKTGMIRTGGTEDGYWLTLAVFRKDGAETIGDIKNCLETDDIPRYVTSVHGLKSAAANIGATKLSEAAKELEAAGNQKNRTLINEKTPALINDLEALLLNISNAISAKKERLGQANIDMDSFKTALGALRSAIDDLDPGAINAAVKELRQFENAAETGETAENILQKVLNGEYDEAFALIEAFSQIDRENNA